MESNNLYAIDLLKQAKFDFNLADFDGRTVLHEACKKSEVNVSTLEALLLAGPDIGRFDVEGKSCLYYAINAANV